MLAFVLDIREWRSYEREVAGAPGPFLVEMIANLFVNRVEAVVKLGLLKSYIDEEENLNCVRGKMLVSQQLRKNLMQQHKTYCQYDEFSNDTLENQTILFSAHILKNLVQSEGMARRINEISILFLSDGISLTRVRADQLSNVAISRLNEYYATTLDLCRFIVENTWIEKLWEKGEVPVLSFLIDMNVLFEDFITKIAQEALGNYKIIPQKKIRNLWVRPLNIPLTQRLLKDVAVKPDMIIEHKETKLLIIDAKYKKDYSNEDIYQASAYTLAFKAPSALILPKESNEIMGCYDIIEAPGSRVFVATVDLSSQQEKFEDYIQTLKTELSEKVAQILAFQHAQII
jgi:5-methylcytosine-specific restriction enzyme subunit McrC